jgi:hypothetical protein
MMISLVDISIPEHFSGYENNGRLRPGVLLHLVHGKMIPDKE